MCIVHCAARARAKFNLADNSIDQVMALDAGNASHIMLQTYFAFGLR